MPLLIWCCTPWLLPRFSRCTMFKSFRKLWEKKMRDTIVDTYSVWYLPSNKTTTSVVLHNIDLNFKSQRFEMLIAEKMRTIAKNASYNFYTDRYSPSNVIIVQVVLRHVGHHFQGQTFSNYSFAIKRSCTYSGYPRTICLDSHGPPRSCSCFK